MNEETKTVDLTMALLIVGAVLAVVGIITGFIGIGSCGSAFTGGGGFGGSSCQIVLADSRREAIQLIAGGLMLLVLTSFMAQRKTAAKTETPA